MSSNETWAVREAYADMDQEEDQMSLLPNGLQHEAFSALATKPGREDLTPTLLEFLVWIEHSKGLTLCHAFKPQYDWYMPSFANKEQLARDFLSSKAPAKAKA